MRLGPKRQADQADRPPAVGPGVRRSEARPAAVRSPWAWLLDPRSAVLLTLGSLIVIGGCRRLLIGLASRRAVDAIQGESPTAEEVAAAARFGRDGLIDLFRLLETAESNEVRLAAGRALVELWGEDDLIAEEEKALIRRGAIIDWVGRRRYPAALAEPIELGVSFRVPFLSNDPKLRVRASNVEWSYKIMGTYRASLEIESAPRPIDVGGTVRFTLDPRDFDGRGPHRLVLQARVRTADLKESWEFEMPHLAFSFELDPTLVLDAILAGDDEDRARIMSEGVRFVSADDAGAPAFVPLAGDLVLRNPPRLAVAGPLPCDLAHRVEIEFEGVGERASSSRFVVVSSGGEVTTDGGEVRFSGTPSNVGIDRPGSIRMRAHLHPDPGIAWATPNVRSLWPRSITTEWVEATVVRR
ncbi:MAG: hypothetical protein SFX72_11935 [Isosphaeraceae bacterium]|nr:hypothetical protein [Isosphaeraceae bacterium]